MAWQAAVARFGAGGTLDPLLGWREQRPTAPLPARKNSVQSVGSQELQHARKRTVASFQLPEGRPAAPLTNSPLAQAEQHAAAAPRLACGGRVRYQVYLLQFCEPLLLEWRVGCWWLQYQAVRRLQAGRGAAPMAAAAAATDTAKQLQLTADTHAAGCHTQRGRAAWPLCRTPRAADS